MAQPKTPPIRLAHAVLDIWGPEAAAIGISTPRLIACDLRRYRQLAESAVPKLSTEQWRLLAHVLDGIEGAEILTGNDDMGMIGPSRIAAEISDWLTPLGATAPAWAIELRAAALRWSTLTIAGVLMRLRAEASRNLDNAGP